MFSVILCSPNVIQTFVPVILYEPSSWGSAFVVIVPRSDPDWGSLRFIVPVHSPETSFGKNLSFCSWLPWKFIAEIAPALKPGAKPKAKLAVPRISKVPPDNVIGIPPPPISEGKDIEAHPASENFL